MNLEIEQGWQIECYRCANDAFTSGVTEDEAKAEFLELGWRQEADGFQMCPQCLRGE